MSQEETVRSILTASEVSHLPVRDPVGLVVQATNVAPAISRIREEVSHSFQIVRPE